ncbi:MAG: hypothetical protein ABSB42_14420 [Tepidisphaeraceae bacterium]|jgi:hypothetical protein
MFGRLRQARSTSFSPAVGPWKLGQSYEERLNSDPQFAMAEGDAYFQGQGAVHETLRRIAKRLDELGIKYAVAGGLALFSHGFRRYTEDVDLLVTPEGLKEVHKQLEGLGYVPPFAGSKNLRDTTSGVKIDFLISGQFPGDGKPKPVAFPLPENVVVERQGIRYLNLPSIVELKIASGMTNSERMKDLADVQELIKLLMLPRDFTSQLSVYVREKYVELWDGVRPRGKKYVKLWRNKFLTTDATSLEQMIESLRDAVQTLDAMRADGVRLDPDGGTSDDCAHLVTSDPEIAKKYDMHEESEFWEEPNNDDADKAETK